MLIRILGAAAGGGYPQWNCHCNGCETVRDGKATPLTQSSIAVQSEEDGSWFLINASPDVRQQIEAMRASGSFPSRSGNRSLPFSGILLTDAEIDHTTGLILLRESTAPLNIYSTPTVKQALSSGYALLSTLQNYCGVNWAPLIPGEIIQLTTDLEVEVFALSTKAPKYIQSTEVEVWGIGLTIRDTITNTTVTYAPGMASIDTDLRSRFENSDCILIDGTFWTNDELPSLGIGARTAMQMGHLPLSGENGSLSQLSTITNPRKIFVHINNTNPILIPNSPERQTVENSSIEIGYDGLTIKL
ncbi:pyrroloquinoline quinone biosynthesis protein B [Calothrix sp. NIES-4071]|nr:pyrroloquinoline quinone biosynthesis protein B [Calothrix sp. NIES-4071]BAZ54482.1 pyrroloquinoline quinone biosynthesis protein B [Calothrix sp. NIES-4105]